MAKNKINPKSKPFVVMDNHRAHTSDWSIPTLEKHFTPLFQPPYSSQFNTIGNLISFCNIGLEWLWAHIKRMYRKEITRIALKKDYDVEKCISVVEIIIGEL
jgi:transposase